MSGRPNSFTAWAAGAYAAGALAWSGTAKRVANAGRYFTPKTLASPQEVNDAIGEVIDDCNGLLLMSGQHAALNWPSVTRDITVGGSNPIFLGAAYDLKYGRWLIYGAKPSTASAFLAYISSDGGQTWSSFGGQNPGTGLADGSVLGVIFNNQTGRCAVAVYTGTGGTNAPTSLTDEETRLSISSAAAAVTGINFNGVYIFVGSNNTTSPIVAPATQGPNAFVSNAAPALSSPTTWCSAGSYAVASSGTACMAIALGLANYGELMVSNNTGLVWTAGTHTATAGWHNTGIAWAGDRWVIMQTNGTDSRVITSTNNGASWATATGTLTGSVNGGVGAIGSLLFSPAYVHTGMHGSWSVDGGVTWQFGGAYNATPQVAGVPDRVYCNGSQFVTLATGFGGGTQHASFSSFMCVPTSSG